MRHLKESQGFFEAIDPSSGISTNFACLMREGSPQIFIVGKWSYSCLEMIQSLHVGKWSNGRVVIFSGLEVIIIG